MKGIYNILLQYKVLGKCQIIKERVLNENLLNVKAWGVISHNSIV